MSLDQVKFCPTKKIPLSKIIFDDNNPNKMSEAQINALDLTVSKYGFAVDPLVNQLDDGTYMVIDGEHRIRLLQRKGVKSVLCKVLKVAYSDVQMIRQIANKLRGEHDKDKDANEFKAIFDAGNLDEFSKMLARPIEDFEKILNREFKIDFDQEESLEMPEKAITKTGDIWELGVHRVLCGDSTKDLSEFIRGRHVDLLLTDPPYGINIVKVTNKNTGAIGGAKPLGFKTRTIGGDNICKPNQYRPIANDDKPFDPTFLLEHGETQIIFGANHFSDKLPVNSHWLVWDKMPYDSHGNTFSDAELMWTNIKRTSVSLYRYVWSGLIRTGDRKSELTSRVHPTQKPVGLIKNIINDYSEENNLVLDPYLGSGTTLIAAEQTNRRCYGLELDPLYVDLIVKRWEDYTGQKAKKTSKKG